jgi:hypothetical protein
MKKITVEKSFGFIIHIALKCHMETPCVTTFISNKEKCHVFLFIFSLFSTTKLENRRAEQLLPCGGGGCTSGSLRMVEKAGRR